MARYRLLNANQPTDSWRRSVVKYGVRVSQVKLFPDERFGDPPPRWLQEPSVVRDRDGRPQEDPLAVHCFCVCSGSALLGDLTASRMEVKIILRRLQLL